MNDRPGKPPTIPNSRNNSSSYSATRLFQISSIDRPVCNRAHRGRTEGVPRAHRGRTSIECTRLHRLGSIGVPARLSRACNAGLVAVQSPGVIAPVRNPELWIPRPFDEYRDSRNEPKLSVANLCEKFGYIDQSGGFEAHRPNSSRAADDQCGPGQPSSPSPSSGHQDNAGLTTGLPKRSTHPIRKSSL